MASPQSDNETATSGHGWQRHGSAFALAVAVHLLAFWVLALSISFQLAPRDERVVEPKIVALAPRIVPPPPVVDTIGPASVAVTTRPRFRPRLPATVRQWMPGDPAFAVWRYLCNRNETGFDATGRLCPPEHFGEVDFGSRDPLNRNGDVGALMGPDTATMSLDEIARKKGWVKPKSPLPADGARAKGNDLGLPGHDPFEFLPKERSRVWGGP